MNFRNTFHLVDCIELMRQLPDASVDFICVDPPFHTTRLDFDQGIRINWREWWQEANRVLKLSGVVCIFASGPFTFTMYAANIKQWRYNLVWEKTRLSRFLDANKRPLQAHEDILVFCRQPGKATYNPQKVYRPELQQRRPRVRRDNGTEHYSAVRGYVYTDEGLRHPGTVLKFSSGDSKKGINRTQKPVDLIRWLVRTYSNPGDVVLDTCAGSATTAIACREENRDYICCELDPDQYMKASGRILDHVKVVSDRPFAPQS